MFTTTTTTIARSLHYGNVFQPIIFLYPVGMFIIPLNFPNCLICFWGKLVGSGKFITLETFNNSTAAAAAAAVSAKSPKR